MMNCISYIASAALLSPNNHVITRSSLYGFSSTSWKRGVWHAGIKALKLNFVLTEFRVQCCSASRARASRLPKVNLQPSMDEESDAFYVVRKGDIVGIYKKLSDCQAQVSSLVCDPSVSVYKGYSLHKQTKEYLASRGLKNALYTMNAADLREDLFGKLVPCPFQQPDGLAFLTDKTPKKTSSQKRSNKTVNNLEATGSSFMSTEQSKKHPRLENYMEGKPTSHNHMSCILEFDGASKGNPGKSGAGVILRAEDGSVISKLREGLGVVTNNVAEYRALILGMRYALKKGFQEICVRGDSMLVCKQVQDLWQTKNQTMAELCKEVKGLKDMFLLFSISHVKREFNSDADAQANLAVDLQVGQVLVETG